MLSRYFIYNAHLHTTAKWFTCSNITRGFSQVQKNVKDTQQNDGVIGKHMYRVTKFDKRVLVWVKRYPNIAAVPENVTVDCLLTARSKARIKICNYMIVATILGCISAAILGKRQAKRGETLVKLREEWYQDALAKGKKG